MRDACSHSSAPCQGLLIGSALKRLVKPRKSYLSLARKSFKNLENSIQLSPEGEMNSGGYIPRRETSRYIHPFNKSNICRFPLMT